MHHRLVLPLLGPNGCGKGTTGDYLKGFGVHVEATSDILEEYKIKKPKVAEKIHYHKNVLKDNAPDEIVLEAVISKWGKLFRQNHTGVFVPDGLGRTPRQIIEFAEWIGKRNAHYERFGLPIIKHGYVFLTLGFEESMLRVEHRVKNHLERGIPPRPEDLGDEPAKRYETYSKQEKILIATARRETGNVTILDLGKLTTVDVASHILAMATGLPSEEFAPQIRDRFQIAS